LFPAVLLLNVGFIAAELVIQAQALNGVTAALSIPQWIVLLAVPSVVIGIFGYRWIHRVMQATAMATRSTWPSPSTATPGTLDAPPAHQEPRCDRRQRRCQK
jgi:ABC-type phosphate transport system permease subunit